MARLHGAVDAAGRSIARGDIDALVDALHALRGDDRARRRTRTTRCISTPRRRATRARRSRCSSDAHESRRDDPITTAGRRALVDLSRDRNFVKARDTAAGPAISRVSRARVVGALRVAAGAARRSSGSMPTPTSPPRCSRSCAGAIDRYEALKARAGALDFLDLLLRARDLVKRQRRRCAAASRRASRTSSSTSSRTPIRCRPRSCCCSPPPIPTRRDWRRRPGSRPPLHRRRSEAVDLSLPPRRRRRLSRGVRAARARGARGVQLTTSFRSVPQIQACVNAAFAPVMTGDAATLQADYVPLTPHRSDAIAAQPAVVALPVPEPYGTRNVSAMRDREVAAGCGRRVHRLAGQRERLDGHRADAANASPSRRASTSASCSAASSASART